MTPVPEADRLLSQHTLPLDVEEVPLHAASGRVLREDVPADRDYPPFDRVAMDGIALAHSAVAGGLRRFRIEGVQRAGEPPLRLESEEACIEIMTGAVLPQGCDTVVRYEDLTINDGVAELRGEVTISPGQNVARRGEDTRGGEMAVPAGVRLTPARIAALASVGKAHLRVTRLPNVTVISTGDELVAVDATVLPHQIRQSNGTAIRAALLAKGFGEAALRHSPDDEAALRRAIREGLEGDLLILSGGVSKGRADLVPDILKEEGVREIFHRVAQKPGKPLWFGVMQDGPAVFGLPGNPVSALVCLYRYVLPYLDRASGLEPEEPLRLILTEQPRRRSELTLFLPVRRRGVEAHFLRSRGSGDFMSLVPSDGFVEIPADQSIPATVPFTRW